MLAAPNRAQGACLPDVHHVQPSRASRYPLLLDMAGGAVWGLNETRYLYTQSILVVIALLHSQEAPPLEIDWAEIVSVPQSLASLLCSLVPTAIPPTPVADPTLTSPRRPTPSGGLGCVLPAPMCCTWRKSGEVRANLASIGVTQLGQGLLGASKDPRCPHFLRDTPSPPLHLTVTFVYQVPRGRAGQNGPGLGLLQYFSAEYSSSPLPVRPGLI